MKDYIVTLQVGYAQAAFNFKDDGETALIFLTTADEKLEPNDDVMMLLEIRESEEEKDECPDV